MLGGQAPALIGSWVGARIIASYMKKHKDLKSKGSAGTYRLSEYVRRVRLPETLAHTYYLLLITYLPKVETALYLLPVTLGDTPA